MLRIFFVLALSFFPFLSYSLDDVIVNCNITPDSPHNMHPNFFNNSSDLTRSVGSIEFAAGKHIHLVGRITDSNCVPISNALIKIWSKNSCGLDQNSYDLPFEGDSYDDCGFDSNFMSNGVYSTDNLGYYKFTTIYPGGDNPHINISVYHDDFVTLDTKVFFNLDEEIYGLNDKYRKLLFPMSYEAAIKGVRFEVYYFNIGMQGVNKYLSY